jgi:acetyl-CoA C-acetyltransferase
MPRKRKLARGAAVIGGGLTKLGLFKDRNCKDFFTEAFVEMVQSIDKGFDPKDIDAIYIGNYSNDFFVNQSHWGPIISDLLGHVPKPVTRLEAACASSAVAFREGVLAIASGLYDLVLVGGFEQMSRRSTEDVAEGLAMASSPYEVAAGFTFPGVFGTMATAYFAKYGTDRESLFNVTIKSHNNAPLNPKAQFPMTIRDFMNARIERCRKKGEPIPQWEDEKDFLRDSVANPPIAWPMHLFDCCPISDGASCLLLAAEDIAKNFTDDPIYLAGMGQGSGYSLHAKKDLTTYEATRAAAKEAYEMSGITPKHIQFSEVHDCFSIAEIVHMEDLGFFKPGEGYKAVAEGLTRLDGIIPINTSGGLKTKGHPVGATGIAQLYEVWIQLRGKAGKRQVPNANLRIGAAHNLGGTGGTCTFTILERR